MLSGRVRRANSISFVALAAERSGWPDIEGTLLKRRRAMRIALALLGLILSFLSLSG